jgi:hypothetical protein
LLLRRDGEAAFGGLAGRRRCGRGRGSHCIVPCSAAQLDCVAVFCSRYGAALKAGLIYVQVQ